MAKQKSRLFTNSFSQSHLIAESSQEGGARDGGRPAANQGDLGLVGRWQLVERGKGRVTDLRNVHVLEDLARKLLQTVDVDGALLSSSQVARADAQLTDRAHHAARQAQRVVRQNGLRSTIVVLTIRNRESQRNGSHTTKTQSGAYLGGDGADESFDVELRRARLLARRVGTLETARGLFQRATLSQSGWFHIQEIVLQAARLQVSVGGRENDIQCCKDESD